MKSRLIGTLMALTFLSLPVRADDPPGDALVNLLGKYLSSTERASVLEVRRRDSLSDGDVKLFPFTGTAAYCGETGGGSPGPGTNSVGGNMVFNNVGIDNATIMAKLILQYAKKEIVNGVATSVIVRDTKNVTFVVPPKQSVTQTLLNSRSIFGCMGILSFSGRVTVLSRSFVSIAGSITTSTTDGGKLVQFSQIPVNISDQGFLFPLDPARENTAPASSVFETCNTPARFLIGATGLYNPSLKPVVITLEASLSYPVSGTADAQDRLMPLTVTLKPDEIRHFLVSSKSRSLGCPDAGTFNGSTVASQRRGRGMFLNSLTVRGETMVSADSLSIVGSTNGQAFIEFQSLRGAGFGRPQ